MDLKQEIDLRLLPEPSNNNLVGSMAPEWLSNQRARFTPYMNRSDNSMGTWTQPNSVRSAWKSLSTNLWPGIVN